ncbi:MAG: hypothetical protein WBH21_02150, partial [Vibrio anguillarum]
KRRDRRPFGDEVLVTFASCPYCADPISCGLMVILILIFEFRHFTTFKKVIKSESQCKNESL